MADQREPTLDELLREPIIRKVMARDGVQPDYIRSLLRHAGKPWDRVHEFPIDQAAHYTDQPPL